MRVQIAPRERMTDAASELGGGQLEMEVAI